MNAEQFLDLILELGEDPNTATIESIETFCGGWSYTDPNNIQITWHPPDPDPYEDAPWNVANDIYLGSGDSLQQALMAFAVSAVTYK